MSTARIKIENLECECLIGVWSHERETPQRVRLDISILVDTSRAVVSDNLADTINQEGWMKEPGLKNWLQTSRLNFESHVLNASPTIKILSALSRLPFLRLFNKAEKAQQKATENVRRLLDLQATSE